MTKILVLLRNGWCTRCGFAYETPTQPQCECAGDPPVNYLGQRRPNFDPEMQAYNARVRGLRHIPTRDEVRANGW